MLGSGLVCRPGYLRAKSLQLLQNGVRHGGPDNRRLGLVIGGDNLLNFDDQFLDAGQTASSYRTLGDHPKPALHLIQPGGIGWRVVDMDVWPLR